MREILFRGKELYGDKWAYGVPVPVVIDGYKTDRVDMTKSHDYDELDGYDILSNDTEVIPETVGQYTGLTDKNGKKIFEGDIVTGLFLHSTPVNGIAAFRDGSFGLLWDRAGAETFNAFTSMCNVEYEIIGNIHDNPDLIKE